MMQLMEKRRKRNGTIDAGDFHRWSPMVADFLSETMSASAKELTQVSSIYIAKSKALINTARISQEWMAESGPPFSD